MTDGMTFKEWREWYEAQRPKSPYVYHDLSDERLNDLIETLHGILVQDEEQSPGEELKPAWVKLDELKALRDMWKRRSLGEVVVQYRGERIGIDENH